MILVIAWCHAGGQGLSLSAAEFGLIGKSQAGQPASVELVPAAGQRKSCRMVLCQSPSLVILSSLHP